MLIKTYTLSSSGEKKFTEFFDRYSKPTARKEEFKNEMMSALVNRAECQEPMRYSLPNSESKTGNAEVVIFDQQDIVISESQYSAGSQDM